MSGADEVFAQQVARRRAISWRDLQKDLDDAVAYEITGSDGVAYQFEVLVLWDDPRARTNFRVLFNRRRRRGLAHVRHAHASFVKAPDDSFVGVDEA